MTREKLSSNQGNLLVRDIQSYSSCLTTIARLPRGTITRSRLPFYTAKFLSLDTLAWSFAGTEVRRFDVGTAFHAPCAVKFHRILAGLVIYIARVND